MPTMTNQQVVAKLKALENLDELIVGGVVWTKLSGTREFKVSPKGTQGDYDTGCQWVAYEELEAELTSETYEVA